MSDGLHFEHFKHFANRHAGNCQELVTVTGCRAKQMLEMLEMRKWDADELLDLAQLARRLARSAQSRGFHEQKSELAMRLRQLASGLKGGRDDSRSNTICCCLARRRYPHRGVSDSEKQYHADRAIVEFLRGQIKILGQIKFHTVKGTSYDARSEI